jgi:hypothetical protein
MKTPLQLACMDEIKGKIEWKGNWDAECKLVYLRDDKEMKECIPFGRPNPDNMTKTSTDIHLVFGDNKFMAHYRSGDKIGILFKTGLGENRLKVPSIEISLKGRMAVMDPANPQQMQ